MLFAPLLSVVIVAYKSRDEIGPCLESIPLSLPEGRVEVVVVDNYPSDGTADLVRDRFPAVKYFAMDANLGFGRGNNFGYRQTNPAGQVVLFLNPDTVCNTAALSQCVRRLRSDPSVGLISPKLVLSDGSMDLACRRSIPTVWDGFCRATGLASAFPRRKLFCGYNLTHLPEEDTYDVGAINGAFMMGRRGVFDAVAQSSELRAKSSRETIVPVGPKLSALSSQLSTFRPAPHVFDENFFMYGDDLDLCIRVKKAGYRIVYDGSVTITHLKGLSVAKDLEPMREAIFDANRDVYLKHFNPAGSRWVKWKYRLVFGIWKRFARWRAARQDHRKVRPL